jgi:prepilin-type processing-associated H-X9-DG protein
VGEDANKARAKLLGGAGLKHNGFNRVFDVTEGDHMPYHVTNALTTCRNGHVLSPVLIHSRPWAPKGKKINISESEVGGILAADGSNPSGIGVAVTKNGSMEKAIFPEWARHFVGQLGTGQWSAYGAGKKAVLLFFDGHASRWSYQARRTCRHRTARSTPPRHPRRPRRHATPLPLPTPSPPRWPNPARGPSSGARIPALEQRLLHLLAVARLDLGAAERRRRQRLVQGLHWCGVARLALGAGEP